MALVMEITSVEQAERLGLIDPKVLKKYGKEVIQKWIDQVNENQYDYVTVSEDWFSIDCEDEFDNIVLRGDRNAY